MEKRAADHVTVLLRILVNCSTGLEFKGAGGKSVAYELFRDSLRLG